MKTVVSNAKSPHKEARHQRAVDDLRVKSPDQHMQSSDRRSHGKVQTSQPGVSDTFPCSWNIPYVAPRHASCPLFVFLLVVARGGGGGSGSRDDQSWSAALSPAAFAAPPPQAVASRVVRLPRVGASLVGQPVDGPSWGWRARLRCSLFFLFFGSSPSVGMRAPACSVHVARSRWRHVSAWRVCRAAVVRVAGA